MAHGQGGLGRGVQTIGWVDLHASEDGRVLQVLQFLGIQLLAVIYILGLLPLLHLQHQAGVLGLNHYLLSLCCRCQTEHHSHK